MRISSCVVIANETVAFFTTFEFLICASEYLKASFNSTIVESLLCLFQDRINVWFRLS